MTPTVTITDRGRESDITYREGSRAIIGYQEYGGGNVVAIVSMGSLDDWSVRHVWAVDRRANILRFVADEVIRQKARGCTAEIDETSGNIVFRNTGASTRDLLRAAASVSATSIVSSASDASWVFRFSTFKAKFAIVVLVVALALGAAIWIKNRILVVESRSGAPFGRTLRTGTHLATLISQLQPYTPSLRHDASSERFTLSVFLVPLEGAEPKLVRLVRDLPAGSFSLARVIGSDGHTLWIAANDLCGVDLRTYSLVTVDQVAKANPRIDRAWFDDTRGMDIVDGRLQVLAHDRSAAYALDPDTLHAMPVTPQAVARQYSDPPLTRYMAAGLLTPPNAWMGVLSQSDLDGEYRPGRWLRAVQSATDSRREARRFVRAELDEDSSEDRYWRIRSIAPIDEDEYRNASFLRVDDQAEPLRMSDPVSVIMLYTSGDGIGPQNTLRVARVEVPSGRLLWSIDTGLERFKLEQVLPGGRRTAFRGTRPPVPDQVSEPLIVMVDNSTGEIATHSLWVPPP
jgi:hypothetical protein